MPRRLLLEGAEGPKLALGVDDLFHHCGTESADQLVLQIRDAHGETERFQLVARRIEAEAGPLETPPEVVLLTGIAEAREPEITTLRAEQFQITLDRLRAPDWHDRNAFGCEVPTTPLSERLERDLVAHPFDEHHRTGIDLRYLRLVRCHSVQFHSVPIKQT